jgi:Flp pilus assembly protein TadD
MSENRIITQLGSDEQAELADELYEAARYHMNHADQALVAGDSGRHAARAAELFERVVMLLPEHWNAMWALGMAREMLQEHERAYLAFKAAYELKPDNTDVCRELCYECIVLGKGAEAVEIAERARALDPDDPGLVANLALAYLIDHQITAALETARDASRRDPDDPVTGRIRALVEAVARHEIEAPTRWPP